MKRIVFYSLILGTILILFGCTKDGVQSKSQVLVQMERIENLWTNNIQEAFEAIEILSNANTTSQFASAEVCGKYVKSIERLQIDAIPLEERSFYVSKCFMYLIHPLYESTKTCPQNERFRFMAHADYFSKLLKDYPKICDILEKEESLIEEELGIKTGNDPLIVKFTSKEDADVYFKKRAERELRKKRISSLKNYKFYLELEAKICPGSWFDSDYHKELIGAFSNPQRTELIQYIEGKLGRKMKWRE